MKKTTLLICLLFSISAEAKINVLSTVPDLASLVTRVGGDAVNSDSVAKGTQDPHFIEAKPSYMTKANHADLVVSMGLDLEVGWLPSILRGARNPKVLPGNAGNLELGPELNPLEVANGKVSRSDGDVHPFGNPHFNLDPIRMGKAAIIIARKLGALDPAHASEFNQRASAYQALLEKKTHEWQTRIEKSGVKKAVSYHKTLTYFFDRFKIENPAILEPKPGIPPTAGHILEVISLIKQDKIPLVLIENFFDPTVGNRIKEEIPAIRIQTVPVLVDGAPGVKSTEDLIERIVSAIEAK